MSVVDPRGSAEQIAEHVAEWSKAHRIPVGRRHVRYFEAGSGPPIVLVHGLGVSADYWRKNGPPLAAAGYRVLAADLPGFGHTPGPSSGLSVPEQARALLAWLDALGIPAAFLVGHSLSCQTILQVAADHPERVLGLVLAAPTGDPSRHRLLRQALGLLRDVPRESIAIAVEVAKAYLLAGPRRVWKTWRAGEHHDPISLLGRVSASGVVIRGARDPVVAEDYAERLALGLPGGRLIRIEGAAHAVIFTHAEAFNAAIISFAEVVRPAPRRGSGAGSRADR